jgi:DNA ligase (NAD+)
MLEETVAKKLANIIKYKEALSKASLMDLILVDEIKQNCTKCHRIFSENKNNNYYHCAIKKL